MKIVFLQDDFPPHSMGGAGFSTFELAREMMRLQHDVSVITTCREKSEAGESFYQGLRVYAIATNYPVRWRAYVSLCNFGVIGEVRRILSELKPDVVHANNIHTYLSYHSLLLARRYAKAVVFTARDTMAFTYGKLSTQNYLDRLDSHTTWRDHLMQAKKGYNPLRNTIIKRYLKNADALVAVSTALARAFKENGIDGVEAIHTGADIAEWTAETTDVEAFKKKHRLAGKKIIFFGGRLGEGKGGGKALEALSLIIQKIPETVLLIAGKPSVYTGRMQDTATDGSIDNHIIYTGWLERDVLKVAYAASDVVLVPSLYLDPLPRILIEGMASGRPVVGSCYGGSPELLLDGVTGYIVNPFDASEIAEKVLELLGDSVKIHKLGEAGKKRIKDTFSIQKSVGTYESLYNALLEK